jgi:putative DNA methylase
MTKQKPVRKKLIEVAIPLEAINAHSVRESYIYRGNPSALHKWWAQRPLAAARAVIFAQMVDDPSAWPDLFPTVDKQAKERKRLFSILEALVVWENINNASVLEAARREIWQSWRRSCADNADHPQSQSLFHRDSLPPFKDPFAGGGTLPLEGARLGLISHASDLNPVAVLINKAMIEIPQRFASYSPVNRHDRSDWRVTVDSNAFSGLAADIRHYGNLMRSLAERRIGHLYPKIQVTPEMAKGRADLTPYIGHTLPVIAWLWSRTVPSPNPAFTHVHVPLASTFMLSTAAGKEAYVQPAIEGDHYHFIVRTGKPKQPEQVKRGTKLARGANFSCLMSGVPIEADHIRQEGQSGRIGARLMAIVAEGVRGRIYLSPSEEHESAAQSAKPEWKPTGEFVEDPRAFTPCIYGIKEWSHLFTDRQLVAMTTLCDLAGEVLQAVKEDAVGAGMKADSTPLRSGGKGATAYAEAVLMYVMFAVTKHAMYGNSLVTWYAKESRPSMLFTMQVLPMVWDFTEVNPFSDIGGSFARSCEIVAGALLGVPTQCPTGIALQEDAATQEIDACKYVISTDPPYYDNVPYADLSDFFYVWLRKAMRDVFPDLFATLAVPKTEELVATPYRHGGKYKAEDFFLEGMTKAMRCLAEGSHPAFPVTIYYAFKQSEKRCENGTGSSGWETFLDAVIRAGFAITGTWPIRTERSGRTRDAGSNALASSIVLVCRPRLETASTATRRELVAVLKTELPGALAHLQASNIAPVDLAQAAIGPGMAAYTRYAKVLDAEGKPVSVREALALINQVLDETLAEQEGEFDADSRWAVTWFEQTGFDEGEYGVAEQLSKSRNTSVSGMEEAGILESRRGKVRLFRAEELSSDWDADTDPRLTAWEVVHQLIRVLATGGETAAAALVSKLGSRAETARDLCYRLYTICERKKRAADAMAYNGLVQAFPEITRLAAEGPRAAAARQKTLLDRDEE